MLFSKTVNYTFWGLLCFGLFACNGTKDASTASAKNTSAMNTSKKVQKLVSFEKGACHGTCPTYEMTIYTDGKAVYNGKRFSDRQGEHTKQLSKNDLATVKAACKTLNCDSYPEEYESRIPDFSKNTLIYYGNGKPQKTAWRENCANELEAFGKQLSAIADNNEGWTMEGEQKYPPSFITNEMIVNLDPKADVRALCSKYIQYSLKPKKRIMPNQNYWLLNYDTEKIAPYRMLNVLNADERILSAEFNKKLEVRRNRRG